MEHENPRQIPINIEDEMRSSYLDYAMSVIVGRALPDVRDGLKPVHRRSLFAMHEMGNTYSKAYKKSARVVGDVIGKYHPHGDTAVYDTIVRLAQDFSMRYPLVDGQGNFGSIDGDAAAAMRYTEVRMSKITDEMTADLEKDTVDFTPNYDASLKEPNVMPCRFPNLLVNGSSGIAVGMTTNIPPHNLTDTCEAVKHLIKNPDCTVDDLIGIVKGPDFPTAGIIVGRAGIISAYRTGRGHIIIRAKTEFENNKRGDQQNIIITEFPYQVNKARTLERIADLVRDKKMTGISDIRDESDRNGIRVVVELKRDAVPNIVLNQLYKHTQLQETFGVIMIALVNRQPKLLNLKEVVSQFVDHRRIIITRRTLFDLEKARAREHILDGLKTAVDHIDEVVALIRAASSPNDAQKALMDRFKFSDLQAKAILEMRLQRLTGLERQKIVDELSAVRAEITRLIFIRDHEEEKFKIILEEMDEIIKKFGDERRTHIEENSEELEDEDLIAEEDVVVILTQEGYIKRLPKDVYRAQRRGGKGVKSMDVKDEDVVVRVFVASTHSYLLIFTSAGKVYRVKVWEIPQASRVARGKSLVNFLGVSAEEKVTGVFSIKDFDEPNRHLVLATKKGQIKKTALSLFSNIQSRGIIAIVLNEGDELSGVGITGGEDLIFIGTAKGQAILFEESDARPMGRATSGVRGIELEEGDYVVGIETVKPDATILTVTENGFGKRTPVSEYRVQSRGGKGVINIIASERNGYVVSLKAVRDKEEIILITGAGQVIRTSVNEISVIGRNTQGVKLLNTEGGTKVISMAVIEEDKE
ncbi:MAG: DNA gyrase subunit A [Nitrospinae bacterium]|nr:DNA gyrase subunit A [Nitrospinota bacterium]